MYHNMWTTPYLSKRCILLTASLPFHKDCCILHTSCTSPKRPFERPVHRNVKLFISNDDSVSEKNIWSPSNDEFLITATNMEFTARKIDSYIVLNELLSWHGSAGWLHMASGPGYVRTYSFKSFYIAKQRFWSGSSLGILYILFSKFSWTSGSLSINEGSFDNDISFWASFDSLVDNLLSSIILLLPKRAKTLIRFSLLALN